MSTNRKEITIRQAAELIGRGRQTIRNWFHKGKIRGRKIGWNIVIDAESLSKYTDCTHQIKPYGEIRLENGESIYPLYGFDYMYATTSTGKILNLTSGKILHCEPDERDGYVRCTLIRNGAAVSCKEHALIARTQCPNYKFKQEIHHIDKIKSNNHASNLLWVTHDEHVVVEKLYKSDRKEYSHEIRRILADNKEKTYKVPNPDWSQYNSDTMSYWYYLDKKGYEIYKSGGMVPTENIICERVEYID